MEESKTKLRILMVYSGIANMDAIQEQRRKVMFIHLQAKT